MMQTQIRGGLKCLLMFIGDLSKSSFHGGIEMEDRVDIRQEGKVWWWIVQADGAISPSKIGE